MEQLSRIVARRQSLENLHELVDALRTMAASHAREAGEALAGTRRYRAVIEGAVTAAAALPGAAPPSGQEGAGRVLIVLGSEHGFVGGFNQRIVERALAARAPGERLILVGQRGAMRADENGLPVDDLLPMTTHVRGIAAVARRLADRLGAVAQARIVYAAARAGAQSDVQVQQLLPAAPAAAETGNRLPPLHHLPPRDLLARLWQELLFAEVANALMESLASENGARLHAMEAAGRNIGRRLDQLRQREAIVRQEEITADLIEIVSGAEAVAARTSPRHSGGGDAS